MSHKKSCAQICSYMPQAMKILDGKAAADKEWDKLEKLKAWQMTGVKRAKREVVLEAQVHFATLLDICHLNNAELERGRAPR